MTDKTELARAQASMAEKAEIVPGCNDDDVINLKDYIEDEARREEEANAVLGGGDASKCSYSNGYMKRQPIFSCLTCYDEGKGFAAVCLACSIECHNGHDVFELYTKRNFRCDCGNSKMELDCKLDDAKSSLNPKNTYPHNFDGLYCSCKRPYPDPDRTSADGGEEMITCCVCEDWHHDDHLGAAVPDSYDEMACTACVRQYPFLRDYAIEHPAEDQTKSDQDQITETSSNDKTENPPTEDVGVSSESKSGPNCQDNCDEPKVKKPKTDSVHATPEEGEARNSSTDSKPDRCSRPKVMNSGDSGTVFFADGWRTRLCTCQACRALMEEIAFLYDPEDTIAHYESLCKSTSSPSLHERGLQALSSLDRTQQIEMISGFTDMKTELTDYLRQFAESGRVVTEADIQKFFAEYKKSQRARAMMPPSQCK